MRDNKRNFRLGLLIIFLVSLLLLNACSVKKAPNMFDNIDGYEYATFEKYNSYAEDNGLSGAKIYIYGMVTEIGDKENISYATVKTIDGQWSIIFGYISSDELKDLYLNKEIYAFGGYSGFSDVLNSPDIFLERVICDGSTRYYNQISDYLQISDATLPTSTMSDNTYEVETQQIDYRQLTKDEFANQVARDFTTEKITFKVNPYSDLTYFLEPQGTNQLIDASIAFYDFGYEIVLTLPTNGNTDECYDILSKGLKSSLFGISFDDQVDILAHYKVGEVSYESNDGVQPFKIKEVKSDTFNMLFITFKR